MKRVAAAAIALFIAGASAAAEVLALPAGTDIRLQTAEPLSSKTHVKGDMVRLIVAGDVTVGAVVVIPAGTLAVGQIVDARAKGAMGMSGRLVVRPLYLQANGKTVRLSGAQQEKAGTEPGAIIGMIALGSIAFTGRTAIIAAGTPVQATVERTVVVD